MSGLTDVWDFSFPPSESNVRPHAHKIAAHINRSMNTTRKTASSSQSHIVSCAPVLDAHACTTIQLLYQTRRYLYRHTEYSSFHLTTRSQPCHSTVCLRSLSQTPFPTTRVLVLHRSSNRDAVYYILGLSGTYCTVRFIVSIDSPNSTQNWLGVPPI